MKAYLRKWIFGFLFCAVSAHATTYTTDLSDLWYNPNESGWGANVIQQHDILFITFFVYNSGGQPVWYVAPATANTTGFTFTGPLYQTAGPWFGGAFNPNSVSVRQAGTATFVGNTIATATLSYTVDGISTSKSLTRQTWRVNNLAGTYVGGAIGTYSGCGARSGYAEELAVISVSHSGGSLSIAAAGASGSCTYVSSNYTQFGRMGAAIGNETCSGGLTATFSAFEIEASISAFTARATANFGGGCTWAGRLGGLVRGP